MKNIRRVIIGIVPQVDSVDRLLVRNKTEDLIAQIVDATTEKNKKKLARALAIAAKTLKWKPEDLHALLQKRHAPGIKNYTAFVWSRCRITNSTVKK